MIWGHSSVKGILTKSKSIIPATSLPLGMQATMPHERAPTNIDHVVDGFLPNLKETNPILALEGQMRKTAYIRK